MIIKNVRLNPFGGVSEGEITLEKGLNVILGLNEAGKSTYYNGIQKALFTPSKMANSTFKKEMKNHIPVGGGDTAKVELQLLHYEKLYTLKKSWGGSKFSELILPDGNPISNESTVDEKIKTLLAAGAGTYKSVLMTYQSGLAKTIQDLDNDPETLHSLGNIIRKTVLETDGVSVERFKDKIEKLYKEYFNHWDLNQHYPEKNRGIENKYKVGVGKVLDAFYVKEDIRSKLERALSYEEELDKVNKRLKACEFGIAEKDRYLKANKKAMEDARKRQNKFIDLKLKRAEITQFSKDNDDWVISENEIKKLNEQLPPAEDKLKELEKERSKAQIKADNEALIHTFSRVEKCREELESAEQVLKSVKKIEDAELKRIRDAFNEVEKLKASVEAGKLRASFKAKKPFKLTVQKDFEDEQLKEVSSGQSLLLEAGGRLKLEHSEWNLEIISGEEEIEKVLQSYETTKKQRDDLLSQYGIQSLKEAEELNTRYNEASGIFKNAAYNFKKELGDTPYEELLQKMEIIGTRSGSEETTRPLVAIVEEQAKLKGDIADKKKQLSINTVKVQELTSMYKSKEKLLIELGKTSNRKDELENEIKSLSPLPKGIEDDEVFISQYESVEEELKTDNDEKYKLLQIRLELEREVPEESAEELDKQQKEAEADFQIVFRKAKAVAHIRNLAENLLEEMDSGTYSGLKKDLEQYISFMTGGRHTSVEMEDGKGLPCGFVRDDGAVLDYELLSAGTKDVLSLALRISMAKHFLKEAEGFLMMDDPFVDMDPDRQQKAGEIIRKFAEDKQVVIFTCHPKHAETLGGNQIYL